MASWRTKGIYLIALTARHEKYKGETAEQLKALNFNFDAILHAPNQRDGQVKGRKLPQKGQQLVEFLNTLPMLPKRVIVVDDQPLNLQDMDHALKETPELSHLPRLLFLKQRDDLQLKGHLSGGSGGVYVLEDQDQTRWTFKCGSNMPQMKEEILADGLYRALGVPVPEFMVYSKVPGNLSNQLTACNGLAPYRVARFIKSAKQVDPQHAKIEMQKHFVVDAFLSNLDIAVDNFKNVVIDTHGTLWRVDNGDSLRYRAVNGRKQEGANWRAKEVKELDTLRDSSINPGAALVYGDISEQEIRRQVQELLAKAPKLFATLDQIAKEIDLEDPQELREMLQARLQYLAQRYHEPTKSPIASAYNQPHAQAAAGILVYSRDPVTNELAVLLGQRRRHQWWGNLGGKSDIDPSQGAIDPTLAATAVRETKEESMGLFIYTEPELQRLPSHDLENPDGSLYRMYLAPYDHIPAQTFNEKLNTVLDSHQKEYTQFLWVPLKEVVAALDNPAAKVTEEGQETVKVGDNIILHAPLYRMLQQAPIKKALADLTAVKRPAPRHTRGEEEIGKVAWDPVNPALSNDKVPFGQNAAGQILTTRTRNGIKETVALNARTDQEQYADAVVMKAKALGEIKGRQQKKDVLIPQGPGLGNLTQSQAYLKLTLGEPTFGQFKGQPKQQIEAYFAQGGHLLNLGKELDATRDDYFLSTLAKALETEEKYKNWYVFYHATDDMMAFLYDVFSAYRQRLQAMGPKSNPTLRALDQAFAGINNVEEFIACFQEGDQLSNYAHKGGKHYQDMGLSVNASLFGSEDNRTSCRYYLFHASKSVSPPDYAKLFRAFAVSLGIDRSWEDLLTVYEQYKKDNGRLYQIFINPAIVDEVGYTAVSAGNIWNINIEGALTSKLSPTLSLLRTNPEQFITALTAGHNWKDKSELRNLQVRLFLKPEYFHNQQLVQIRQYQRLPFAQYQQQYHQKLQALVDEDLSKWLQKHRDTEAGMLHNGKPVLQNLYKAGYEGITGNSYQLDESNVLLPLIDQGDTAGLANYFETYPDRINQPLKIAQDYYQKHSDGLLEDEQTALSRAIINNVPNLEAVIMLLLNKGANPNQPLLVAAARGLTHIMEILVNYGADVNWSNDKGIPAIHQAAENGHKEAVAWLLSKGVKIEATNSLGSTALHKAAVKGQSEVITFLLSEGANVNAINMYHITPLHLAAEFGHKEVVNLLLSHGANVNEAREDGGTALHFAVLEDYEEIAELLLSHGADVNAARNDGSTAIDLAIESAQRSIIELLLAKGASLNLEKSSQKAIFRILNWALSSGNESLVKLFLAHGADISELPKDDLLNTSIINERATLVKLLLTHGANPNWRDKYGTSPLRRAIRGGNEEIISLLLAYGADVNEADQYGDSYLEKAISNGNEKIVGLLLVHGVDANGVNQYGEPYLSIAIRSGNEKIVEVLLAYGADPKKVDEYNKSLLEPTINGEEELASEPALNGEKTSSKENRGTMLVGEV